MSTQKTTMSEAAELVIERSFKAPVETIWRMLTEAQHLAHWWGPAGSTVAVKKIELRPGGVFHYSMTYPDGNVMWGLFVYREVVKPGRLVFVNGFANAAGEMTRAPFFEGKWPLEVLNVLTLESTATGTLLVLKGKPVDCTEEEAALFKENANSMHEGFKGTFDQLDAYLDTL